MYHAATKIQRKERGKWVFLFSILLGFLMCSSAYSQSVVIYEHPNFGGRSQTLGIGSHTLSDLNDAASSIKVPAGLVAVIYESADSKGGYGIWVDFLEDQPDLSKYNLNEQVSYISVFNSKRPDGLIWARNSIKNEQFLAGHWERPRASGPPVNTVAVVGPPIPPRDPTGPSTNQGNPVLNDLAKKITATPDFSGAVKPGQTLNVTLNLPPELGGTARRRSTTSVRRRGMTSATPCNLWPNGCPPPIPLPTEPGTPRAQLDKFSVQVRWWVFESAFPREGTGAPLAEGKDFVSPTIQPLSAAFIMAPLQIVEYKGGVLPDKRYMIVATVSLSADKTVLTSPPTTTKVSSAEIPLTVPLSLSALPVPKVFVLFLNKSFGGAAAIYVPADSPLNVGLIKSGAGELFATYKDVASKLNFVTWFASYVAGLEALKNAFELPHVDLKELKNIENDLNDDDFIHRSPYTSVNDTEVEDESSSLLLLGPPNTKVQFFQDTNLQGGEFDVQTGALKSDYAAGILIRDFDSLNSEPLGKVTTVRKFMGSAFPGGPREITPNDQLSSFKWVR